METIRAVISYDSVNSTGQFVNMYKMIEPMPILNTIMSILSTDERLMSCRCLFD